MQEDQKDDMHEPSKREKRAKEVRDRLTQMQNEFFSQKDTIYVEKLAALTQELDAITKGSHPEWLELEARLKLEYEREVDRIGLLRDYQLESASRLYELEKTQAIEDYAVGFCIGEY
jgi:hypothetical protein